MRKYLLPIGSVVRVLGFTKPLMVIGILQTAKSGDEKKLYDYIGVTYPEGRIDPRMDMLFNHEYIQEVLFRGYETQERTDFIAAVDVLELAEKIKKEKNAAKTADDNRAI